MRNLYLTAVIAVASLISGCASTPEGMKHTVYEDYQWDDSKSYALNVVNHAIPTYRGIKDVEIPDEWLDQDSGNIADSDAFRISGAIINGAAFGVGGLLSSGYLALWENRSEQEVYEANASGYFIFSYEVTNAGQQSLDYATNIAYAKVKGLLKRTYNVEPTDFIERDYRALSVPVIANKFCALEEKENQLYYKESYEGNCLFSVSPNSVKITRVAKGIDKLSQDQQKKYATVSVRFHKAKFVELLPYLGEGEHVFFKKKGAKYAANLPFVYSNNNPHLFVSPTAEFTDVTVKPEFLKVTQAFRKNSYYRSLEFTSLLQKL